MMINKSQPSWSGKKCCNCNSSFWVPPEPGYFSLATSGKMISRFVSVCSIQYLTINIQHWCSYSLRLLLMLLLLSVILVVVTSGGRDLTRDTDGDGLRWAETRKYHHNAVILLPGTTLMILTMTTTGYSIFMMMMTMETVKFWAGFVFLEKNLII